MRRVEFGPLARSVSAIGFGCASLGSRIDAGRGRTALDRAYDAGVTWFDVAPSYGDGQAEDLLGSFLRGKRSQVTVCTKVGLLPRPVPLPMRMARPLAQRALAWAPGLRKYVVKVRPAAQAAVLSGAFIESSVVESLRRLRTDYVDVFALHEPRLADVERDDVLQALASIRLKGYVRTIACTGYLKVSLAVAKLSEHISIIQVANNPFHPNLVLARQQMHLGRSMGFVTHSVYGQSGALDALVSMIKKGSEQARLLDAAGYRKPPREAAAAFLLDFALACNPDGVVLVSMFQRQHLSSNLERLELSPPREVVLELGRRLVQ